MDLKLPATKADMHSLHVGDFVFLSGTIFTGRDALHKYLASGAAAPCDLTHAFIYHCGPIIVQHKDGPRVVAAGPTTSAREEPYMADLIERFQLRGIIGKGGMGRQTLAACRKFGCVYLHAVGGAAQVLAHTVSRVTGVYMEEEFGSPEAMWELEVCRFPAIVTMDAHGNSLHQRTATSSLEHLQKLFDKSNSQP